MTFSLYIGEIAQLEKEPLFRGKLAIWEIGRQTSYTKWRLLIVIMYN